MKRILMPLFYSLFVCFSAFSQSFDQEEYNGKIESVEGESIIGDIHYEAASGNVKVTNEKETLTFSPRTASYFQFYDYEKNAIREFYSLLYNNIPTFFELLKETPTLALLTKVNVSSSKTIAYLSKSASQKDSDNLSHEEKYNSETLYLVDEKGRIKPYVVINNGVKTGVISNYVSPYLLSTLTKGKYNEIRKFARDNRYSLKDKEDLIEVLSYYEEISNH